MRHGNRINALGRKKAHRESMLANMACSLIEHKRINTTVAKAKELRKYVEPLITKSKTDSTHSRRIVFSYLKQKDAVSELFREVAPKVAERPGGYLRIIKTGRRLGDSAEMCMVELVDFNELMLQAKPAKAKRSRRGGKKKSEGSASPAPEAKAAAPEAKEAEEKKAEANEEVKAEAPKAEAAPEAKAEKPEAEAKEDKPAAEAKEEPKEEKKEDKPAQDAAPKNDAGDDETKAEDSDEKEKKNE